MPGDQLPNALIRLCLYADVSIMISEGMSRVLSGRNGMKERRHSLNVKVKSYIYNGYQKQSTCLTRGKMIGKLEVGCSLTSVEKGFEADEIVVYRTSMCVWYSK
ncbi:hypothetical protein TNCV_2260101 [Trichonephila clavipes]|nr:hypothetical protein TNCV_2260101 [Trichonephila clavipes]